MSARPFAEGAALVALLTAVGFVVGRRLLPPADLNIVYLLVVLTIALRWGRWPATFTAVLSAFVFDFCFIPPYFSFAITDLAYLTTLVGFLVVAIATSELASRSRRLQLEQTARARAEARSEAKDEILDRISHELRGPLTTLLGWTQLLTRPGIDTTRLSKAISGIDHSGQLLARLVDDLVCAARINARRLVVDRHPVMIDPVIASTVAGMIATAQQKGIQLDANIEPVGPILADEQRIQQITTNLLSNAIKFTPAGGRVSVTFHRAGRQAELVVSDTGVGINADFLPHVFESFAQGSPENAKQGLGLGLSIADHLVHAHDGTIAVTSQAGQGTTFTVRLPVIPAGHMSS
jgi:signal transduction histidine kinase